MQTLPVLSLLIIIININYTFADDVVLQIPNGRILGRKTATLTNKTYFAFQKIPYAQPPVGHLRFQPPEAVKNWEGIRNATILDVMCYQQNRDNQMESEDCLYLNVFTPQLNSKLLPVMVWIHGGNFIGGHSLTKLYGPEFLLDENIIVVTFNYRLGIFGFLSTGDHVIPGNYGLKDQLFALEWIHRNIEYFGGDPEKITIFGESAGSVSVTYHLLNRKSRGLYRGAICQSGSALNPFSLQLNPKEIACKVVNYLNTSNTCNNSTLLRDYLLNLPAEQLDQAAGNLGKLLEVDFRRIFSPVIEAEHDEAFITTKPYVSFRDGNFINVPVIFGVNSEEAILYEEDFDFKETLVRFEQNLDTLLPDSVKLDDKLNRTQIVEMIEKIYANGKLSENLGALVKFLSDSFFNRGIIRNVELVSKYTNTYLYQFSYDGIMGNVSLRFAGAENVSHFEEVRYLWHITDENYDNTNLYQFPESDITTHHRLLKLWTNFAKTLNPTPEPTVLLQNITWTPVSLNKAGDVAYLDIGENLEMKVNLKKETYRFWKAIFESFGDDNFDTY